MNLNKIKQNRKLNLEKQIEGEIERSIEISVEGLRHPLIQLIRDIQRIEREISQRKDLSEGQDKELIEYTLNELITRVSADLKMSNENIKQILARLYEQA